MICVMRKVLILILLPLALMVTKGVSAQTVDGENFIAEESMLVDSIKRVLIDKGVLTQQEWNYIMRQRDLAADTVPVKQRESERKRKRMITNYRYVAKGDVAVGLALSFANYDTEDSQFFSIIKEFSGNVSAFAIKPFVAYFYKPNSCVGVKYSNTKIDANLNSLNVEIDESLDFGLGKTGVNYALNTVSLIHRSYVGLDRGHRFALFNETALGYSFGHMDYNRTLADGPKLTETQIQEVRLGLNPGLSVFVMDGFTVEASVGIAGIKFHSERQTTNGDSSGWRKTLGMDYKFNIFNIQIGLVAYL